MWNTADIYDAHHQILQVCALQFRSFGRHAFFSGKAETLRTFEDHTPVLNLLSEAGNQRVLVVDASGSLRIGVMGDRLAEIAVANGWAGVVINGAIRDSVGIAGLAIGVKALGTTARRGWQQTTGERGPTVSFGGVTIESGDWVYADVDAVLVSPHQLDLSSIPGVRE